MSLQRKITTGRVTALLERAQSGDARALDDLIPLIYEQLKRIAKNQMRAQSPSHTLSPTGLVHEVFIKLKDAGEIVAKDRAHFFAIAARSMRWLLTDYARGKTSQKRGGQKGALIEFDENRHSKEAPVEPSALDAALERLERQDPRLCRVVELRQLVGLTIGETAEALGVSPMTVKRDWLAAKAWLARELTGDRKE